MYEAELNFRAVQHFPDMRLCVLCGCLVHADFTLIHELALHKPYDGD